MSRRRGGAAAVAVCCLAASAPAHAGGEPQTPASVAPAPNNYTDGALWLCRPGRQDACAADLATMVVAADGGFTTEAGAAADPQAPVDCFYVYPTVSTDAADNSDVSPDPAEQNVVRQQFARFGSKCRPYAPVYRQITLAGLRRMIATGGGGAALSRGLQYDDVRDAWRHYLEHDNRGRGVVLVGHSQGSYILAELIRQEIDGKAVQSRVVSALLLGATLAVPRGRDVGGAFQHLPLCRAASQTGCLVAFSSFRATVPPPANTRFGKVADPGMVAACTNPAALGGGSGALHAYLSSEGRTITGISAAPPWVVPARPVATPWVSVPGLLTARCTSNEHATFLEVTVNGNPSDSPTDDISGDLGAPGRVATDWGLHLIDVNLVMGNLVDIVGQQAKAWLAGVCALGARGAALAGLQTALDLSGRPFAECGHMWLYSTSDVYRDPRTERQLESFHPADRGWRTHRHHGPWSRGRGTRPARFKDQGHAEPLRRAGRIRSDPPSTRNR